MITLQPQDLLVLLKLFLWKKRQWTYTELSASLFMPKEEVTESINRTLAAHLMVPTLVRPNRRNLFDFIVYGVRHVFVPSIGNAPVLGIPTAAAAQPLKEYFIETAPLPPVWPSPQGVAIGWAVEPLCPSAILASLADIDLYGCLALIDALRIGTSRERKIAIELLDEVFE